MRIAPVHHKYKHHYLLQNKLSDTLRRLGVGHVYKSARKASFFAKISLAAIVLVIAGLAGYVYVHHATYNLSDSESKLLGRAYIGGDKIKATDEAFSYNSQPAAGSLKRQTVVAIKPDASGRVDYQATVARQLKEGITFGEAEGDLSFQLKPLFNTSAGREDGGRLVYPDGIASKHVYSFKRNGLKEDIILAKAGADTVSYDWDIATQGLLEARLLGDGSVGLYSANPNLYGQITISDDKSRDLVDKARHNGKKDHLAFVLPAPYIVDAGGKKAKSDTWFTLSGTRLTLHAKNLKSYDYPLSIDPTVVVTTTADFTEGTDDGMISYGTAGQITRAAPSLGTVGAWSNAFTGAAYANGRYGATSVAYNGYLYVIGGVSGTFLNDAYYAAIAGNGTLGAFSSAGANFTNGRYFHASVAYNGYLYIIGGSDGSVSYGDVQYMPLNTNGTFAAGTWSSATNTFTTGRWGLSAAVSNGYLYITGGNASGTLKNDAQFAKIRGNGDLDAWTTSAFTFTTPRYLHTTVAYNGYLYVVGGAPTGAYLNDIQYIKINADGTIGNGTIGWITNSTSFNFGRYGHAAYAYQGYLYVSGGQIATASTANCKNGSQGNVAYCSDTQYAQIRGDGSVGTWNTSTNYLASPTVGQMSAVYNGYLYSLSGYPDYTANGFYTPITTGSLSSSGGTISSWTNGTATFDSPNGRYGQSAVAYNGYLYIMGGAWNGAGYKATIYYGAIANDGNIPSSPGFLPTIDLPGSVGRSGFVAVAANGYIYLLGGDNTTTFLNDAWYTPINTSTGALTGWVNTTTPFTTARWAFSGFAYNNYLYVTAGQISGSSLACKAPSGQSASDRCSDVQYIQLNPSGGFTGSWNTSGCYLNTPRSFVRAVAYNGYAYIAAGNSGSSRLNTTEYTAINSDGSLSCAGSRWTTNSTNFSGAARDSAAVYAYDGYLYVLGGDAGSNGVKTVDVGLINANGSITWNATTSNMNFARAASEAGIAGYGGRIYITGGYDNTFSVLSNFEFATLNASPMQSAYEQVLNTGVSGTNMQLDSIVANGSGKCGMRMYYRIAGSDGIFGATTSVLSYNPGQTITITAANKQYVWVKYVLDDEVCGAQSTITDITLNWSYTSAPPAPTLSLPANAATGVSTTPTFQMRSTQANNAYLRYKIDLCSTSNCSSVVQTITQPTGLPQTGWTGQDQQTGTAYTGNTTIASSTMASYAYQTPLSMGTQYWWRAYAVDPGNSNTYSSASSIFSFTTLANTAPTVPTLTTPSNSATGVSTTPLFQLSSTDANSDYLDYKIDVCSTSNCSSIVRTIDQTILPQTGWTGQNAQAGAAYASGTLASHDYQVPALNPSTQYWWRAYAIDPGGTNVFTSPSGIASFTTGTIANTPPTAPTLSIPNGGATSVATSPTFQLSSTDADSDYLRYKIDLCSTSNCSSVVATIDQTASQTGWTGQNAQTGTAYTSGSGASYSYQLTALNPSTQYWWRAYAIDPGGTNIWSGVSSISTFTTGAANATDTQVRGGTKILGGTRLTN